ncbi:MAG: CHAD domain-containing protein [Bacteroidia bacterium]|nr:CHAD domain-containing protein [Bacteroidia bacterium]
MSKKDSYIRNYHRKLTISFLKDIHNVNKKASEKNIHKLRVSIKKLRALWFFIESVSNPEFKADKHRQVVKALFKKSGVIREAQINENIADNIDKASLVYYKVFLKNRQRETKQDLEKVLDRLDLNKLKRRDQKLLKSIQSLSTKKITSEVIGFVREQMEEIKAIIDQSPDDYDLHEIRKHFRNITSILAILKSIDPKKINPSSYKRIRRQYVMIGEWHDQLEFISSLAVYLSWSDQTKDYKDVKKTIKSINELIEKKQKAIRKSMKKMLKVQKALFNV